jgi:[ribosomal protein S5]-alanine N-acetyltransferase
MIELETERLRLIPLDNQLLHIWHEQGRNAMEAKLRLNPSEWQQDELTIAETMDAVENFWLPMTDEHVGNFFWFTNWEIVLVSENLSIGGLGFAGMPDEDGKTAIGYMIDAKYWGKGYATEAVAGLIDWAMMDLTLKTITADTEHDNIPSQIVLEKNGFIKVGEGEAQHTKLMQVINWELRR